MLTAEERAVLETAPVARLATADAGGRPSVVPICFAPVDTDEGLRLATPIDEKPKTAPPDALRRVRDVRENPAVAVVVDRYVEDWSRLGWLQLRGRAAVTGPGGAGHGAAVAALRAKYDQYAGHALEDRPAIEVAVGSARSWGELGPLADG